MLQRSISLAKRGRLLGVKRYRYREQKLADASFTRPRQQGSSTACSYHAHAHHPEVARPHSRRSIHTPQTQTRIRPTPLRLRWRSFSSEGGGEEMASEDASCKTAQYYHGDGESNVVLRVLLIRHAESLNNKLYRELYGSGREQYWDYDRHPDPPLTDQGWEQAETLATRLEENPSLYDFGGRSIGIEKIYTSAMHRAMQTAAPLHRRLKIPTEVWTDIHETGGVFHINHGPLGGMNFAQICVKFPSYEVSKNHVSPQGWWRGGAETYEQMVERAHSTKSKLVAMAGELDADCTIAVVSHGSFISALLRSLTHANCAFALLNTGISCVDIQVVNPSEDAVDDDTNARVRMHYLNST